VRHWLARLVEAAGGEVEEDRYVTRPGCRILARTTLSSEAAAIFEQVGIDRERPEYEQLAEFGAGLTYLSFQHSDAEAFNRRMARELQHLSVHAATSVTFLLAGVSVETSLELLAHAEAKVARLTSSKTRAMNETLYRLQGSSEQRAMQRAYIEAFLRERAVFEGQHHPREGSADDNELFNILNLGAKATALTYTMSLKDYHRLFIGRLTPQGNETEVREVCALMCRLLQADYPLVIRAPEEYAGTAHGEKYRT